MEGRSEEEAKLLNCLSGVLRAHADALTLLSLSLQDLRLEIDREAGEAVATQVDGCLKTIMAETKLGATSGPPSSSIHSA